MRVRILFDIFPFHVGQHHFVPAFYIRQFFGLSGVPVCAVSGSARNVLSGLVGRWEDWLLLAPISVLVSDYLHVVRAWVEILLGIGFFRLAPGHILCPASIRRPVTPCLLSRMG